MKYRRSIVSSFIMVKPHDPIIARQTDDEGDDASEAKNTRRTRRGTVGLYTTKTYCAGSYYHNRTQYE